jgi:cation diffusion facilitator CzcD-associated flavoprotein CzcO
VSRGERRVYRRLPLVQRLVRAAIYWTRETFVVPFMHPRLMVFGERIARRHLRRQVPDPALRAKLTPRYRMGCKRVLPSNDYYPALTEGNVELLVGGVSEVRPGSVVCEDGTERQVDTIIFGTGFHVTDSPALERIRGRDGRSLAELWRGSPKAHLGTTVAGFPNMFMLLGPGTGLGHNSVVFMIECQIGYLLDCLRTMGRLGVESVEVRSSAQEASSADADRRLAGTVWATGGCASWYQDASGRLSTLWPGGTWRYRRRMRRFDPEEYVLRYRMWAKGDQRADRPRAKAPA